jgi:hypothetical protein
MDENDPTPGVQRGNILEGGVMAAERAATHFYD